MFNSCMDLVDGTGEKMETLIDVHEHFYRKIKDNNPRDGSEKIGSMSSTVVSSLRNGEFVVFDIKDKDRFLNEVVENFVKAGTKPYVKESEPFQLGVLEKNS